MQKMRTELGRRIRELRKANGWSQEVLGERANLHPTYVGGIERGEKNLSFDNLHKLAGAFRLTLAQFLEFPEKRQDKRHLLKARLYGIVRDRPETDLELLVSVAEALDRWRQRTSE